MELVENFVLCCKEKNIQLNTRNIEAYSGLKDHL